MKKTIPFKSLRGQAGFSLIELIIAGVLMVGMMLAAGVFNFSGDQSKATNILGVMKELGGGADRYATHTSVNPKAPVSLFDKSKNTTAETQEGLSATATWQGPYVNGFAAGTNGEYKLDAFVEGATATFAKVTSGLPSGAAAGYEVVTAGLPQDLTLALLGSCNGVSYTAASTLPADHATGAKCAGTIDATTKVGTVKYLYRTR
ncbi:MAG: hypothetical protein A2286_04010 [Gammaproteobacteria bacterium RIFOXYA12_FULL_61_12]|nr:MAG: hypothetical protein A2514_14480 [Gammaproteobacteria bacterium RIFOXYD12_FULL_61_37]OGT94463.1 MAG: hypothetical protein A2286_04010 [Gammaproteobacteria bacterium RIFOXYA12_FULL_61_12]